MSEPVGWLTPPLPGGGHPWVQAPAMLLIQVYAEADGTLTLNKPKDPS